MWLPESFRPHVYTVILGRGKLNDNIGNRRLKIMIDIELHNYEKAKSRREKSYVVTRVMDTFQSACEMGAFVRQENRKWFEVPDQEAREKISTMFRDKLSHQYKSSTSNKMQRRRQRRATKKPLSIAEPEKPISFVNMDFAKLQAELGATYQEDDSGFSDCGSIISF